VSGNTWQAGNISVQATGENPIVLDYVNIGDALESAPIQRGRNVRLELTLFEEIADVTGVPGDVLTGFAMTLLGGAKGGGSPTTTGPTESQGARYPAADWSGGPVSGIASTESTAKGITYDTPYASVYAADASSAEGETVESYMKLSIQKVEGLLPQYVNGTNNDSADFITDLLWNGSQWVDSSSSDNITVGANISTAKFGPELTVSGTYNVGASGKPWKFTADGVYLITFALKDGSPIALDANTLVRNDDPDQPGFQPLDLLEGRLTQVVGDGALSNTGDTHNGLLAMLVGVPSSVGGGGEAALAGLL